MKKIFDSLNGWKRIGVVLSVLWFFIAGLAERSYEVNKAYEFANNGSNICYESHKEGGSEICRDRFSDDYKLMMEGSWANVLAISIVPIPIFWGLVILVIKVYRWIREGFSG